MRSLVAIALALLVSPAGAAPTSGPSAEGFACLAQTDLECAQRSLGELLRTEPGAPHTLALEAHVRFHEGRYDDAVAVLDRIEAQGGELAVYQGANKKLYPPPIRETAEAAQGLETRTADGVVVRTAPGVDRVLADEALESLLQARSTYDVLLGGGPSQVVPLDVFPTATRFIAASGLPPESVRTTGVVALSKWNRLLVTSPRALADGYAWKDTIAHEYIHLVVSRRTNDQAPVWLQEGLAKYLEGYWRGDRTGHLSAYQQSLLADALHSGGFVPFEKFRQSMAYLDSGEEAALAFAQVATMVSYLVQMKGDGVLSDVLDRVRAGESAESVVATEAGFVDFDDFHVGWREWLAGLPLVREKLASLPVVLDGEGGEFADDPLLSGAPDRARFVRLGDLLREADRPKAALVEYAKAEDEAGPPSPTLLARKATCLSALGDPESALAMVQRGVDLYPEFTLLQVTLGRLLDERGSTAEAAVAWQAAHDLNPYDPEVQAALVRDYDALDEDDLAERHRRYARILATGGAAEGVDG